jgi:hypothetical protein
MDWKKFLQICGADRELQNITQKVHVVRGHKSKWEIALKIV